MLSIMKEFINCFLFFALFFIACREHPTDAVIPKNWSKILADIVLPSRCAYVVLKMARPYGFIEISAYDKNVWNTGNQLVYYTKIFDCNQEELNQYARLGCAPIDALLVHYKVYDESEKNFNVIIPNEKDSTICNDIIIEPSVLNAIIGKASNEVIVNQQEKLVINGNKCNKMNIETENSIGNYYYFKRGRFSFILGTYSRNKRIFYQNQTTLDSIANTFEIHSY